MTVLSRFSPSFSYVWCRGERKWTVHHLHWSYSSILIARATTRKRSFNTRKRPGNIPLFLHFFLKNAKDEIADEDSSDAQYESHSLRQLLKSFSTCLHLMSYPGVAQTTSMRMSFTLDSHFHYIIFTDISRHCHDARKRDLSLQGASKALSILIRFL